MANATIPGPLGSSLTLQIDSGTLIRAASPVPGSVNLDDWVGQWARREVRRRINPLLRRGVEVAAEALYTAALAELRLLRNDVEAQLRLIAALPDEIRQRVAYEAFAAGFSHYLPKLLLRHYVWGRGAPMRLSLRQMIDCNPHINLLRSQAFRSLQAGAAQQPGVAFPFELAIPAGALTNGTLGQFSVRMQGMLVTTPDGGWQAQGSMTFHDFWDFDPKDWTTGGRSLQGEVKTRVANVALPGQGFHIDSVSTAFSQSQADSTVVWAGGVPVSTPDRIAELDFALSQPDR